LRSQIKHVGCECTTVGRKAANVPRYNTELLTYGETLLNKTNSVRTCVTYERTPIGQTELLQWDNKLRRNVNETTKIALTYG